MLVHIGNPQAPRTDLRDPQDLLGEGGEAKVYGCALNGRAAAAKIFKPGVLAPKMSKLATLIQLSPQLPTEVMVPQAFIYDPKGQPIGTVANLAEGEDLVQLCQIDFKENAGLDNNFTNSWFTRVHTVLNGLHTAGMVVGDFNYNNWKFKVSDANYVAVMDVDGMAVGSFRCMAMHPMFFDPRFRELLEQYKLGASKLGYQIKLSQAPNFDKDSDWYSFTTALFWALMTIHPFQGSHPKFFNEFTRMEARLSILNPAVKRPKIVVQPEQLDDDLAHYFHRVFEKDERGPFPLGLLKKWNTCKSCGLSFSKRYCPSCQIGIAPPVAMSVNNTCTMRVIGNLVGKRLLAHSLQGGKLRYVYEENGELKNQDGAGIIALKSDPNTRVLISMDKVYIGIDNQIYETWPGIQGTQIAVKTTEKMGRLPVFGTNSMGLYRILGTKLVGPDDRAIGNVTPGKCWFAVGEQIGFGFNKIGMGYYYFLFRAGQPGFFDILLPNPKGKMIDWSVYFGDEVALYTMSSELNGKKYHEMFLIRADGEIISKMEEEPINVRLLGSINGKVIWNKSLLLTTTDDGILSFGPEVGSRPTTLGERKLFGDTAKFVKMGNEMYLDPSGKMVYVITNRDIISLTV